MYFGCTTHIFKVQTDETYTYPTLCLSMENVMKYKQNASNKSRTHTSTAKAPSPQETLTSVITHRNNTKHVVQTAHIKWYGETGLFAVVMIAMHWTKLST